MLTPCWRGVLTMLMNPEVESERLLVLVHHVIFCLNGELKFRPQILYFLTRWGNEDRMFSFLFVFQI